MTTSPSLTMAAYDLARGLDVVASRRAHPSSDRVGMAQGQCAPRARGKRARMESAHGRARCCILHQIPAVARGRAGGPIWFPPRGRLRLGSLERAQRSELCE